MIVFDSAEVEVLYYANHASTLIVTFAPHGFQADQKNYWGKSFVEKLPDAAALGIVAKRPNWYPQSALREARIAIGPILDQYPRIVTYGASMGGYAALKFSNLLGATTAIAFSPQYSINPADGVSNSTFTRHFSPALHDQMRIEADDMCEEAYVFYDPFYDFDAQNVNLLRELKKPLNAIPVPLVGHECIRLFAGFEKARSLISACQEGDIQGLRDMVAKERRHSPLRTIGLANRLAGKNPSAAKNLFERNREVFSSRDAFFFYDMLAAGYVRRKQFGLAESACREAMKFNGKVTLPLRRLATIKFAVKEFSAAAELCHDAIKMDPRDHRPYGLLSEALLAQGDVGACLAYLELGTKLAPADADLQKKLLRASRLSQDASTS